MDINLNSFNVVNEIKYTDFNLDPSKPEFYDEDKFDKNLKMLEKDLNLEIKSDKYFENAHALVKLSISIIQLGIAFNVGLWGKLITLIVGNIVKTFMRIGADSLEYKQAKLINKDTKYSPEDHANMLISEMSKAYESIDKNKAMSSSDKKKAKDILDKNMAKLLEMFDEKQAEFIRNRTPGLNGILNALHNNNQAYKSGAQAIKNQAHKKKVNESFSYLMK